MMAVINEFPTAAVWGSGRMPSGVGVGYDLRGALRELFGNAAIGGVGSVRLLPSETRYAHANDKVFFILSTHDVRRDEQIVRLMLQFEAVDYDLVPYASECLVPTAAVRVV